MFALIAVILFALGALLALIGEGGDWNWVLLFSGLFFLGLHHLWGWTPWTIRPARRP